MQVRTAEAELRHKLFPPNAWMKVLHFNVLTSCPKDELHQWFIGLYGEHIIPAIVHQVLQRPDLFTLDKNGDKHPLISNEAVARVFKRLADRLQGVVSDTSTITITPEYVQCAAHFLEVFVKKTDGAKFTGDRIRFLMMSLPLAVRDLIAPEVYSKCMYVICRYILCRYKSYAN